MQDVLFHDTIEHRFVFAGDDAPKPLNDIAKRGAVVLGEAPVPDTDLKAQVWRIPAGSEMSIPDRDHEKLRALTDGNGIPYLGSPGGQLPSRPPLVASEDRDRTSREEAERVAADHGHTLEGAITDPQKHLQATKSTDRPMAPEIAPRPDPATAAALAGPQAPTRGVIHGLTGPAPGSQR